MDADWMRLLHLLPESILCVPGAKRAARALCKDARALVAGHVTRLDRTMFADFDDADTGMPSLARFAPSLTSLRLRMVPTWYASAAILGAADMPRLSALSALTALRSLFLEGAPLDAPDDWLAPLASLPALRSLTVVHRLSANPAMFRALGGCTALETLDTDGCNHVLDFACLVALRRLTQLSISECNRLTTLPGCAGLRTLHVDWCYRLEDLSSMAALTALRDLSIGEFNRSDVSPLAACTALEALSLKGCRNVSDLRPLRACAALREVRIRDCESLTLPAIAAGAPGLQELHLAFCHYGDLAPLAACPRLRELRATFCHRIADLSPLTACKELRALGFVHCSTLRDMSPLAACRELRELDLERCRVRRLTPLAGCAALRVLCLNSAEPLENDLSPLAACAALRELHIQLVVGMRLPDVSALLDRRHVAVHFAVVAGV
jgi:Leucine-rich repeat (LRR) protein